MVSSSQENQLVYGIKLSSVGPAKVTGTDVVYEPTNMDLAMKLHYLRGVYYFRGTQKFPLDMPIVKIKEPMFYWLNHYFVVNGRFRRWDSGRPYIKCNDCGVRFIEAKCSKTLDEWLEKLEDDGSLHKLLVSNQVIGPELAFSPPVLVQFTWFKCGGFSLGLSLAHVLGDAFSASDFVNMWGQIFTGHEPVSIHKSQFFSTRPESPRSITTQDPLSVKRIDPVGDNWITPTNCKMATHSFKVSATELSKIKTPRFETICAFFWKKIAQTRDGPSPSTKPNIVTVIRNGFLERNFTLANSQIINTVNADVSIMEADVEELANLLVNGKSDEKSQIEESMERDEGLTDFVVYGGNLTFVNWEESEFYGLELKGEQPALVSYTIDGVGEKGAVLVLPCPKEKEEGDGGRIVTVILPENEVIELKRNWFVE